MKEHIQIELFRIRIELFRSFTYQLCFSSKNILISFKVQVNAPVQTLRDRTKIQTDFNVINKFVLSKKKKTYTVMMNLN